MSNTHEAVSIDWGKSGRTGILNNELYAYATYLCLHSLFEPGSIFNA